MIPHGKNREVGGVHKELRATEATYIVVRTFNREAL